jgi:hypothetical protein
MPGFKRAALTILTLIQRCMEQMMDDDRGPVEKSISLHFVGLPKQIMFALTEKALSPKLEGWIMRLVRLSYPINSPSRLRTTEIEGR